MSFYTEKSASGSRMAAAALLAVSAGACLGVALSFTPVANMYSAPTVTRPVASVAIPVARTQASMQAMPSQYSAEQAEAVYSQQYTTAQASSVSPMTVLSGGLIAAAAGFLALALKRTSATQSEQLAMVAASGKKAKAPRKSANSDERPLWYPYGEAPEWLDGSLPGDRGFDPLGLAKPVEFLQFDLDALDQNAGKNPAGRVVGRIQGRPDEVSTDAFQPYSEVFGIQRFRECELQHGRWAMLGVLGCIVGEVYSGVPWQSAGLVEATQPNYLGFDLPYSGTTVVWIEVLAMGAVEAFRNSELNTEKRCYPGGAFDPLGLASGDAETVFRLREAELKHGRLAMIAFLGFAAAALKTGAGATVAFSDFTSTNFS